MRLGQLARKYDVSLQEIISYLNEVEPNHDILHPNSKVTEEYTKLIEEHFEPLLVVMPEQLEDLSEELPNEIESEVIEPELTEIIEEAVEIEETVEESQNESEVPFQEPELQDLPKKEDEVIETDRLLELLESEETPVDLSKITLIKAPKKELSGLKVVGKIELVEPKTEQREKESKPDGKSIRRRLVSDEELEERRFKAKKKKEDYEARQENRRIEKEKKQRKALREAHYQQKLQRTRSNQPKVKNKKRQPTSPEVTEQRPKPKTLLGKFLRWLNT